MNEYLSIWEPLDDLPKPLYINSIQDNEEGLTILLEQGDIEKNYIKIRFGSYLSYRNTKESFLLEKWHNYDRNELSKSNLFIVENSEYVSWIEKSSLFMHRGLAIVHYAIYTVEDCLEVLTTGVPTVYEIGID